MPPKLQWIVWVVITSGLVGYLAYSLFAQPAAAARTFLPGVTTHGHYQIELACHECHTAGMGVQQDSCTRCHAAELKAANDTHPSSKFSDPSKMHLLDDLDARSCITCHTEHVPDRTLAMGLTMPADYCWHCHEDIAEDRPSHAGMAYDSCSNAGCHNYHDNRALFEAFLVKHVDEPEHLEKQRVPERTLAATWAAAHPAAPRGLGADDQDAPAEVDADDAVLQQWASTAHAAAGVNCAACHTDESGGWSDRSSHEACRECHADQVDGFLGSRHGMRLSVGLSPMTPDQARLPMKADAAHRELSCVACHQSHEFDTAYAAVEACLACHNDAHSLAYLDSPHHDLWLAELAGEAPDGSGVSCATCHLPRIEEGDHVVVAHNQNDFLRPNEKLARPVCGECHGLPFTLDALADDALIRSNFNGRPAEHVKSPQMAKSWADERAKLREKRKQRRGAANQSSGAVRR